MNVAPLDLCRELYELSGWGADCEHHWLHRDLYNRMPRQSDLKDGQSEEDYAPAYDLGYLIRKLPGHIVLTSTTWDGIHTEKPKGQELDYQASACYQSNVKGLLVQEVANTPEDALCKLAIQLFKQGVLTRNQR